ncbi:MAG: ubiquinol-cytochrome c reductase iron-sulfur subunit [Acidimicrobiia bacterium]
MATVVALEQGQLWLIAAPVLVGLAAMLVVGAARRRDVEVAVGTLSRETRRADRSGSQRRAPATAGRAVEHEARARRAEPSTAVVSRASEALEPYVPPSPEVLAVTRRQFLNRSIVNVTGFGLTAFGLATLGFLWPRSAGGFGAKIRVGTLADIEAKIADGQGFAYYPEGRMWVTAYPGSALDKARATYDASIVAGMERGIVALYQKCPHLGCRVPQCLTSQWFECPCHGSQYNRVGEKKGGPAPRGMDRFPVTFAGDQVTVDTGVIVQGPPIGTNTTGQEAEGPHCVGGGGGE